MSNKKVNRVPVNRKRLDEALLLRKSSIRKLGELQDEIVNRTEKTIRRYLKVGEMPPDLLDQIGRYLDIDPAYLSGKYDRDVDKIDDSNIRRAIKAQLKPEKFPYLIKQQTQASVYNGYLENILVMHSISMCQFNDLAFDQQKQLQLEIEDALIPVIARHFAQDAKGQAGLPDLEYLRYAIDSYNPDEPDMPDDVEICGIDEHDPLAEKYAHLVELSDDNIE